MQGRLRYPKVLLAGVLPMLLACSPPAPPTDESRAATEAVETVRGLPLVFADDFSSGRAERWEPTDPEAWEVVRLDARYVYSLKVRFSDYEPLFRSPLNISWIRDLYVGSFVLDVVLQSTADTGDHRDLCLFFGRQSPSRFYYVHLGRRTDAVSNQIHVVNDADRTAVTLTGNEGTPWTDGLHRARVVRDVGSGSIEVFFDDFETPAMTATDTTFSWGRVGIGSFDDTGNFFEVKVYGDLVAPSY